MNTQNQTGVGQRKTVLPLEGSREEEICIEHASSGSSQPDTLRYRGRYLYSKYNPERAVLSLIQATQFLPGTIIILCSPCLWYGLRELFKAVPKEDVEVCAIEADRNLHRLAKERLEQENAPPVPPDEAKKIRFYFSDELDTFEAFLNQKIASGKFKRVLRLDFSAGIQFNPQWYTSVCTAAEQMVASYWKNRITIVKMGRLFSHNIFKNLCLAGSKAGAFDSFLQVAKGTVSKPILVLGAGESLDRTFAKNNSAFAKDAREGRYFIIAVDAAAQALLARGIRPNAIVAVESQFAIQESYADFAKADFENIILFADLCSRVQVARLFKNRIWFASEYAKCTYLDALKERGILQSLIPPLGSVGLTALYIALVIRKSIATSVFVSGMDFSYSAGITHAKNVTASKRAHILSSRKNAAANYSASLLPPAFPIQSKDQSRMYSLPVMESYAQNFAALFGGQKNLYDMGECGIDLHLKRCTADSARTVAALQSQATPEAGLCIKVQEQEAVGLAISAYLAQEKEALETLRDLLSNGENSPHKKEGIPLTLQIEELLFEREYLFLHFPDGNRPSTATPFLKRVRAEIDSFLKILCAGSATRAQN